MQRTHVFRSISALLIFLGACAPSAAQTPLLDVSPSAPLEENLPGAEVSATFTAPPPPPPTATITLTFFPTITPLPTATLTPSITPTPQISETPTPLPSDQALLTQAATTPEVYSDPVGSEYACQFIDKKPGNWAIYPPKTAFDAIWKLRNVGTKTWAGTTVRVYLLEGPKFSRERSQDLYEEIKPDKIGLVKVDMITPKEEGYYAATYGLRAMRTGHIFCTFTVRIIVKR